MLERAPGLEIYIDRSQVSYVQKRFDGVDVIINGYEKFVDCAGTSKATKLYQWLTEEIKDDI